MPRRGSTQAFWEVFFITIAVVVIIFATLLVSIWNFLVETNLIWFMPVIIVGAIILGHYAKKSAEEERVQDILGRKGELGDEMCQWLINNDINTDMRVNEILQQFTQFGEETCKDIIQTRIAIGMTNEMVRLSRGKPTTIDNHIITSRSEKIRWVYGIPRRGATYVWFRNGKVVKIKQ